jgi:hypothetical protein
MTNTNRERYIVFSLVLIALLAFAAYLHIRSPFDGTWLKVQGPGYPEMTGTSEMTVRLARNEFAIKFFKTQTVEGLERVSYLVDGREHTFRVRTDGSKLIYRAELAGSNVIVTYHIEDPSGTSWDWGPGSEKWSERWSLSDRGRKLTLNSESDGKSNETVFQRAPLLREMLAGTP